MKINLLENWNSIQSGFLGKASIDCLTFHGQYIFDNSESKYFVLNCYFTSACGRYAFWRLINNQAPEAESKLSELGNYSPGRRKPNGTTATVWVAPQVNSWVMNPRRREPAHVKGIIPSVLGYFSKLLKP